MSDQDVQAIIAELNKIGEEYFRNLAFTAIQLELRYINKEVYPVDGSSQENMHKLMLVVKKMRTDINLLKRSLIFDVLRKIHMYASKFNVDATKLDAYKTAFWYCEAIVNHFPTGTESHLARFALAVNMGEVLRRDIGKDLSPIMKEKVINTLLAGDFKDVFGEYGLYMIYKNCSRVCRDQCADFKDPIDKQMDA